MFRIRLTHLPFSALVLAATLGACDAVTAPDSLPEAPAAFLGSDGLVPISIRESAVPDPGAPLVICEPAAAGVVLPSRLLARGHATHMGRVRSVVTGTWCGLDLATGVVSVAGTAEHTAASGDHLLATWTGTISGNLLELEITLAGGTGRFTDACGWIVASGHMDPVTGAGNWTGSGRMTPPGD